MKEYIGLKRSRKYEIEETEEVLGIDKDGFIEIRQTRFNPVDAKTSYRIRRLTGDGREVHISNRWDDFTVPEPEKKLANGGWDNNWPDVLKRKWPVID